MIYEGLSMPGDLPPVAAFDIVVRARNDVTEVFRPDVVMPDATLYALIGAVKLYIPIAAAYTERNRKRVLEYVIEELKKA